MVVRELECPTCDITVRGRFETCQFCTLSGEQLQLIRIFLRSRGNIKEVERELGISYPTVRSRLDDVIRALGFAPPEPSVSHEAKTALLDRLESGEIDVSELIRRLDESGS
jgi:hypothetical protein